MIGAVPVFSDDVAIFCAGLVVKDLVFDDVAALLEFLHGASVGWDAVAVVFGLEGLDEDDVGVAVVGDHDVLIATARADGESAHVVGEELTDGPDPDVKFVGSGVRKRAFDDVDG